LVIDSAQGDRRMGFDHWDRDEPMLTMIVGTMALIGGIIAMFMIDGPGWMVIELPLYLLVAWAVGRQVTTALDRYSKGLPAEGAPHDG
jgi:hypothetical protein